MTQRLSILKLSAQYRLSPQNRARLMQYERAATPAHIDLTLARGTALLAASLAGLALVFWVAANWAALGRIGSFVLLQSVVVLAIAGAICVPRARPAFGLVALLGIGALFAYFGQTYQTGADPWQLFALWSALALSLGLAIRHDGVWVPWAIVSACAISLWLDAHAGSWWGTSDDDLAYYLGAWAASIGVTLWLSPLAQRFSGAGPWSMRLSALFSTGLITAGGIAAVFGDGLLAVIAIVILSIAGLVFAKGKLFDLFSLSVVALAINVILDCFIAEALFSGMKADTGMLIVTGLFAALLLAATVGVLAAVSKQHANGEIA